MIICIYIQEAHFVERDQSTGSITEGWPIGYYEYEFGKHKSMDDRYHMVEIAFAEMKCLRMSHRVLVDYLPHHDRFLAEFGAWPDQAFCIDVGDAEGGSNEGKLLHRGEFLQAVGEEYGGIRKDYFTKNMEKIFAK